MIVVVAMGLGLFAVGQAFVTGVERSSRESVSAANQTFEEFNCVERSLRRSLPAGARILVDEEDDLWDQRLVELATPHLMVVNRRQEAEFAVSVDQDAPGGACRGLQLEVAPG